MSPCTAALGVTGTKKCFNSLSTCQDRTHFNNVPVTLRFAVQTDYLPPSIDCIPDIPSPGAVSLTPAVLSLGQDLGTRATLSVTMVDHRHSDVGPGFDKYVLERAYDPWKQGTFFGKFRARQPYLRGRPMRVIRGTLGQALADMETRHYLIDSFDGPTPTGAYSIAGKDVLKLADGDRALAPKINNGFLSASLLAASTTTTLNPTGIGNAEYPASGTVAIGGNEICTFTRSGDVLTLARGQFNTVAVDHAAQDRAQVCLLYTGQKPSAIIDDLLVNYAEVPASYIDLSTWTTEVDTFLNRVYTAVIAEPTAVKDLVSELIEQAGLVLWWDDVAQKIRLQVLRAVATDADVISADSYVAGSLDIKDQPEKRVSQVWTYYGKINPLLQQDELRNYRSTAATVDLQAETDYGSAAIKVITSRWIPAFGRTVATRLNDIIIGRYRTPPRYISFKVHRGNRDVALGGGYQLSGQSLQDDTGLLASTPIQVTRVNPDSDVISVESEELFFVPFVPDSTDHVIIVDSNTTDFNLRSVHDSLFGAPVSGTVVRCVINSGVRITASSTAVPALDVGSWPAGVSVTLDVRGTIQGAGGQGGDGAGTANGGVPTAGKVGGTALYTRYAITLLASTAVIWAGGGGGGGGGESTFSPGYIFSGAPGGGGAGDVAGLSGASLSSPNGGTPPAAGAGTQTTGGQGSFVAGSSHGGPGGGGDGGGPGLDGGAGQTGAGIATAGAAGGTRGASIDGVSHVTISTGPGDRRGREIN